MKQLLLVASVCFLVTTADFSAAQDFLKNPGGSNTNHKTKQPVYKCGDNWSYYPCPQQTGPASDNVAVPVVTDSINSDIHEVESELVKIQLLERLDDKIRSVEQTHKVVPNHAYKIEGLCKNPEISVATCARLIDELETSMKSYDKDQVLAELERREAREMDEKKRLAIRVERLNLLKRRQYDVKETKKEIDKF